MNVHALIKITRRRYSYLIVLLCLYILPQLSIAQTPIDSLLIAEAHWQEKTLKPGITWRQAHFENLFESQQEINLLEIDLSVPERRLAFVGLSQDLKLTSEFAREADALGAINATFFDTKLGGSVTFLKINKQIVNETSLLLPNGANHERANGALIMNGQEASIVIGVDQTIGWDKQLPADHVMVCGPTLLHGGAEILLQKNAFNDNRHPRSAVGLTADNKIILLTVDGRNALAHGMNLHQLAFLLRVMDVQDALNLDGGGSTTLYIKGENHSGVVNYPSDNKAFDHDGERKVANAILVF
ncbi:phosphodiester glycosidase family protein [Parapedobacter tibetensis]|uniref:phosphodiester glycosidase family protein n=1 Tax=Parapedobacter tibetensis TaxID=2972951 RepID=UPI00214D9A6C|nr:phosphodiester glycosidase family protein [Parapedobacter tibetensis]